LFFSATVPPEIQAVGIVRVAAIPERIEIGMNRSVTTGQPRAIIRWPGQKFELLAALLAKSTTIVCWFFSRTKHGADKIAGV